MARNKWISREGPTHKGIVIEDYTSFDVYLISGLVFLLGFTISVVFSAVGKMETMVWPGWALTLIVTFGLFFWLRGRELRRRKANNERAPRDPEF